MRHDLILHGGTLIDPSQKIHARKDIAFKGGRVSAVDDELPRVEASEVIDCTDRIVAPGMIDLHVHVFSGVSYLGIDADSNCVAKGVTTAVDAGSAGADTFPGFRKYVIDISATRLLAQLNIASQGMLTEGIGEFVDLQYANVSKAVAMIEQHRDVILGVKVRLTKDTIASREAGLRPLHLAREAADAAGVPMMVHPNDAWCDSLDDVLAVMRERDILTHCFHGMETGILDGNDKVRRSAREAIERGVIFDVGHGAGSFTWRVAEAALREGVQPQTISSDLHKFNVDGPVFDLATTVSKFLHLGLSLDEALHKVTASPAKAIRMSEQIGTLKLGAWGDAVVFEMQHGRFDLWDAEGQRRVGRTRLAPATVVRAGKIYAGAD